MTLFEFLNAFSSCPCVFTLSYEVWRLIGNLSADKTDDNLTCLIIYDNFVTNENYRFLIRYQDYEDGYFILFEKTNPLL